jgi:hypothetical protein
MRKSGRDRQLELRETLVRRTLPPWSGLAAKVREDARGVLGSMLRAAHAAKKRGGERGHE